MDADSVKHACSMSSLRFPSQPQTLATAPRLLLISCPAEDKKWSWPEWMVIQIDGTPVNDYTPEY